jgi:hypothetical protein
MSPESGNVSAPPRTSGDATGSYARIRTFKQMEDYLNAQPKLRVRVSIPQWSPSRCRRWEKRINWSRFSAGWLGAGLLLAPTLFMMVRAEAFDFDLRHPDWLTLAKAAGACLTATVSGKAAGIAWARYRYRFHRDRMLRILERVT